MNSRRLKEMLPRSLRRRLAAVRRQLQVRPSRTRWQKARLLSANSLEPAKLALLGKVESRISQKDEMYAGDGDHYFKLVFPPSIASTRRCNRRGVLRSRRFWICRAGTVACFAFWCVAFRGRGSPRVI